MEDREPWDTWVRRLEDVGTWAVAVGLAVWETAGQARPQVYGFAATLLGIPIARRIDKARRDRTS